MSKIVFIILFGAAAAAGLAQEFQLVRHTVDSGGAVRSKGGNFELSGTIGQPDVGSSMGGGFRMSGGFWFESPSGDCNTNGFVDLADHAAFVNCMAIASAPRPGCECHDTNGDEKIDLRDYAMDQQNFVGVD